MTNRFAGDPYSRYDVTDDERNAHIAAIAANTANEQIARLLSAIEEMWYPDSWPDMIQLSPSGQAGAIQTIPYQFPGIFTLAVLELQAAGGTYPTVVDVTIAKFSNLAFSLSPAAPRRGPYGFRVMGGTDVRFANLDAVNSAYVYIEWSMYKHGK